MIPFRKINQQTREFLASIAEDTNRESARQRAWTAKDKRAQKALRKKRRARSVGSETEAENQRRRDRRSDAKGTRHKRTDSEE